MATQQYKAWSVVIMSTLAFTVCFMIWMMFAVIGIPIKATLGLNETQFGILVATPGSDGFVDPCPAGDVDGQIRRAHRVFHPDAVHGIPDLDDFAGNPILAFPRDWLVRWGGWWFIYRWYCVLRPLVS